MLSKVLFQAWDHLIAITFTSVNRVNLKATFWSKNKMLKNKKYAPIVKNLQLQQLFNVAQTLPTADSKRVCVRVSVLTLAFSTKQERKKKIVCIL